MERGRGGGLLQHCTLQQAGTQVATLSHRLAGPPIERRETWTGRDRNGNSSLLDQVKHEHVERFPDTKAEDFKSCKQ